MKWTKQAPTEPGWYWVRMKGNARIRKIVWGKDFFIDKIERPGLWIVTTPPDECDECGQTVSSASNVRTPGWMFSGPIEEPTDE